MEDSTLTITFSSTLKTSRVTSPLPVHCLDGRKAKRRTRTVSIHSNKQLPQRIPIISIPRQRRSRRRSRRPHRRRRPSMVLPRGRPESVILRRRGSISPQPCRRRWWSFAITPAARGTGIRRRMRRPAIADIAGGVLVRCGRTRSAAVGRGVVRD